MSFQSVASFIEEMLGNLDPETAKPDYPFGWRVGCVKMCSPRHERFDFVRDMGADLLDKVFNNVPISQTHITFMFPERHMSVHEQQAFTYALSRHQSKDTIEQIDLITSSPLIMSSFKRDYINILTWSDDEQHNGQLRSPA